MMDRDRIRALVTPLKWGRNPAVPSRKGDSMKKTAPKKMTLARETLHQLTVNQAEAAFGGLVYQTRQYPETSDSRNVCCA
jgi:hypothetical protein